MLYSKGREKLLWLFFIDSLYHAACSDSFISLELLSNLIFFVNVLMNIYKPSACINGLWKTTYLIFTTSPNIVKELRVLCLFCFHEDVN